MHLDQIGIVQWFRHNEYERVERAIEALNELRIRHLRIQLSWADVDAYGTEWYDWLFPKLKDFELLPCALYTPHGFGVRPLVVSAVTNPATYASFINFSCERWGEHFDVIQLWNEANGGFWLDDPDYTFFDDVILYGSYAARHHGKRVCLGGMAPIDPYWIRGRREKGVLGDIDIVGVHAFAGTWDDPHHPWKGWWQHLSEVHAEIGEEIVIWADEVGRSSRLNDQAPIDYFEELRQAPLARAYWYSLFDHVGQTVQELAEGWVSIDDFHMGLIDSNGVKKPLFHHWYNLAHEDER